jgi:hypothetical protein
MSMLTLWFLLAANPFFRCHGMPGWNGIVPGDSYERKVIARYGAGYLGRLGDRNYTNASREITLRFYFVERSRRVQGISILAGFHPAEGITQEDAQKMVTQISDNSRICERLGLRSSKQAVRREFGRPTSTSGDTWSYEVVRHNALIGTISFTFANDRVMQIDLNTPLD